MTSRRSSISRCTRVGVADIELLLTIVIFITIVMLVRTSMQLGLGRLQMGEDAAKEAFKDATANSPPMYAGDGGLPPVAGYLSLRPGLPNRTHVPRPTMEVPIYSGDRQPIPPFLIGTSAGLPSPPWSFSAYPVGDADRAITQAWFETYAAESHSWVNYSLGLAPVWTP